MADQNLDRVLELLWERAEAGSVSAQKALYDHYRRDEEPEAEAGEWAELYEAGNISPLRRKST